ncbi:hypothetical protein, partial [Corynebacterium sp.]|uniref:DUF7507 domain-containing protein n=1 Tax=Corynebacterium sp. TaxID=1720 RepID=UPI0025C382FA
MEGDTITYSYVVSNPGDVELSNVSVSDDKCSPVTPVLTSGPNVGDVDRDNRLDKTETWEFTCTYTVDDDDANSDGDIINTATATGKYEEITVTATDTASVTLLAAPNLSLTKQIATSNTGPWQDSITVLADTDVYYQFTVTNGGNVPLSDVTVEDPDLDVSSCAWVSLARGADPVTCVAGPVKAEAGVHTNTAYATGLQPDGEIPITSNSDTASYTGLVPGIEVVKTASVSEAYPGDTVVYSYTVKNTGEITLTNVTLTDDKLGAITLADTELAPGASTTGSASYTVTADDHPEIVNTATASGTATVGSASKTVTDEDSAIVYVILANTLTIVKDAAGDTTTPFGFVLDTEQLTLAVLPRDGELPLTFNLKGGESQSFDLEPGAYIVTESVMPEGWVLSDIVCEGAEYGIDIESGSVYLYLSEGQNATCTFSNRYPQLSLTKEVGTSASGPWGKEVTVQVGSDIYYRMTVTNSGNAPLSSPVVNDPALAAFECELPDTLEGGQSASCVLGPVEAEAGTHVNTAQATALFQREIMRPVALAIAADGLTIYSDEDSASYTGVVPGLTIIKVATPTSAEPGAKVVYTLEYANTGTMDLTGVTITDTPDWTYVASVAVGEDTYTSGSIVWEIGPLAAAAAGSVSYEATLKDETAFAIGQTAVDNVAVIDSDQTESAEDKATVTVTRLLAPEPALTLTKVGSTTTARIGDVVDYTLTVQNTGNITLTNVIVVDAKLGIEETIDELAPGASAQVTGSYTVTEADLDGIVNTATADSDQTDTVADTWTVEVISGPALSIEKVGSTTVAKPGDTVDYTITVKNIGDVTLTNVTVVDAKLGINA